MQPLMLIEPEATFVERHSHAQDDVFAFTQADKLIFGMLQGGPTHTMKLVNVAGRRLPAKSKRQKVAVKRATLVRIGELIRHRQLVRKGNFIALPYR